MRWRIAKNKWNVSNLPWRDAIGIEEDDDILAVPGLVCWFTREAATLDEIEKVISDHNAREVSS